MGYWGVVNNCFKNSDIVLQIIDSRIPKDSINSEVIRKAEEMNKKVIFVFSKIDLISKENLENLRKKYENSFFVSVNKKGSILNLLKFLNSESEKENKTLRIALIGYPNVGKSSILNILVPNAKAKVSFVSGTTKKTQWIRVGNLRFMDTPGVISKFDNKVKVGLTASKDVHKLKNPDKVAYEIIKILRKQNIETLENGYGINVEEKDSNYDVLVKIGIKKNYLLKGGEIDENRTVTKIIEDWQRGKIKS